MAEKRVIMATGREEEIDDEGNLWGFKVGDIITGDDRVQGYWVNKRIVVEGFKSGWLYGRVEGEDYCCSISKPDGLILLERPERKFKVGDEVEAIKNLPAGHKGKVIVLYGNYLVEFKGWEGGHDGSRWNWQETGYPEKYKTESKSRRWCREGHLKLLKSADTKQQPKTTKPKKPKANPEQPKTLKAIDEMLKLIKDIKETKDIQKLGKTFYHLFREAEGSPRHPEISYSLDGYPRLKDDDTWRIIVKLWRGEYKDKKEIEEDLKSLKG